MVLLKELLELDDKLLGVLITLVVLFELLIVLLDVVVPLLQAHKHSKKTTETIKNETFFIFLSLKTLFIDINLNRSSILELYQFTFFVLIHKIAKLNTITGNK